MIKLIKLTKEREHQTSKQAIDREKEREREREREIRLPRLNVRDAYKYANAETSSRTESVMYSSGFKFHAIAFKVARTKLA